MDIEIKEVQEIIKNLESGGELSIKEEKYLKAAKLCVQLAAENVALKAEQVRIFNSGYLRGHESTVEGYYVDIHHDDITTYHEDVVAEISEEQTPATDRIVAGIKADGVEEMASTYRGFANNDGCSVNMKCSYNLTAERAESYAAYIRHQMREVANHD